jgi:hypothetical protein
MSGTEHQLSYLKYSFCRPFGRTIHYVANPHPKPTLAQHSGIAVNLKTQSSEYKEVGS